jgi:hypothetical protein
MLTVFLKPSIVARVVIAVATFMFGVGMTTLIRSFTKMCCEDRDETPRPFAANYDSKLSGPDSLFAKPTERISQYEVVAFPGIGDVEVCAHEDIGESPTLVFSDFQTGKELLTVYVGSSDWKILNSDVHPGIRFRVVSIHGLPRMVIAVGVSPGGSDSSWESVAVGVVNGQLEILTFETLRTSDFGGFSYGDLGHGLGVGAAQWDFVWGEDEGHPPPHQYEVKLFKWNGRRFEWYKLFRTRRHYESDQAALSAYGFHFVDIRGSFPDWDSER